MQRKNKDAVFFQPNCAFLWNVNPNGVPSIHSKDPAVRTRYGIINFTKTFVQNPSEPNELKGDARFKHDLDWVSENVTPAAFNELLALYVDVLQNGIDYDLIDNAYDQVQRDSSHIAEWMDVIGLTPRKGCEVTLVDLWDQLE